MKSIFLLLTAYIIISSPVQGEESVLIFKINGVTVSKLNNNKIDEFAKQTEITILDPHEKRKITFIGYDFNVLLKRIYGDNINDYKDLIVICSDGYKPVIPLLKFTGNKSYLVYGIKDRSSFSIKNKSKNNETIQLGPFYLVWENIYNDKLQKEGSYDFPYKVTGFDLVDFNSRFYKMLPPEKSSDSVEKGFLAYRKYCSSCHTINGEGGEESIELNYPVNITEYFDRKWLKKWIRDPTSIRFNSKMPAFSANTESNDELIDYIIDYLETMKHKKISP